MLDAPDKVYVLDGPKASPFEKRQANETAENIERARPEASCCRMLGCGSFQVFLEWGMDGAGMHEKIQNIIIKHRCGSLH